MNKLKAAKLSGKIFINFLKSPYYQGETTMEEDLKRYMENDTECKKLIEKMKKEK